MGSLKCLGELQLHMTRPYDLTLNREIPESNPLHWRKFWPNLKRLHPSKIALRQSMILWIANLHYSCSLNPKGFNYTEVRLTDLRDQIRDYHVVLDHFFDISQHGFCFDADNFELSKLVPKVIDSSLSKEIAIEIPKSCYIPPARPEDGIVSKVQVLDVPDIEKLLTDNKRYDLWPQVKWIINNGPTIEFVFKRSGKLQQRDTSVWPIQAIEIWPSWLREKLFGPGIDLDSAYVQFILKAVQSSYDSYDRMKLVLPDLVDLIDHKEDFRHHICVDVMKLPFNERSIKHVKQIIMAIANGSRISPNMISDSSHSESVKLLINCMQDADYETVQHAAERLQRISFQFSTAKKIACLQLNKCHPSRVNQRGVFKSYFEWEREARYAIWEACGRTGIMVHDGIDGISADKLEHLQELMDKLDLKLSAG